MSRNRHKISIPPVALIAVLLTLLVLLKINTSRPKLDPAPQLLAENAEYSDSLLVDGRQMGYVDLERFTQLAVALGNASFNPESGVSRNGDSVTFVLNGRDNGIFFADFTNRDDMQRLRNGYYTNFPITILPDGNGFTAKVETFGDREYLHIPYLVLASLADRVEGRNASPSSHQNSHGESDDLHTISNSTIETVRSKSAQGDLIQIENNVLRNFSDIMAATNSRHISDPGQQLAIAWKYVKERWQYIRDPHTDDGSDTWRSAEETISNYYSNNQYYSGDCDDFAILMASFARQVGCRSGCVGVFNDSEGKGHMYAQFYDPELRRWRNMDWFDDQFDGTPYQGRVICTIGEVDPKMLSR